MVWEHVRCLSDGECVSLTGTHLGHNLPDRYGNRYCINLVSIAGSPVKGGEPDAGKNALCDCHNLDTILDYLPGRSEPMEVAEAHFVLETPMKGPWPSQMKKVVFATGCFWGGEKGFWRLPFSGVHATAVGYAAGCTPNPTYEEVCTGQTGATEAVQVVYDPAKLALADLLRWFWQCHDPTQGMGQGGDRGTQYRSGCYYFDETQRQLCEASRDAYALALGKEGFGPITTELRSASAFDEVFYYAEDYHQQYLAKPGNRPYCSAEPTLVSLPPFETWAPPDLQTADQAPKLPEAFWEKWAPTQHCVLKVKNQPIIFVPSD